MIRVKSEKCKVQSEGILGRLGPEPFDESLVFKVIAGRTTRRPEIHASVATTTIGPADIPPARLQSLPAWSGTTGRIRWRDTPASPAALVSQDRRTHYTIPRVAQSTPTDIEGSGAIASNHAAAGCTSSLHRAICSTSCLQTDGWRGSSAHGWLATRTARHHLGFVRHMASS